MANPVNEKGYQIMTTAKVVGNMGAANPRQVVGLLYWYNAPKGFIPGKNEDARQGYGIGSEIITKDRNAFKCLDNTDGKAIWIKTQSQVTSTSYDPSKEPVKEPEPTPEPEAEETIDELTEEEVRKSIEKTSKEIQEAEKAEEAKGLAPVDLNLSDEAFDELPYRKFIIETNGIKTLSALQEVVKSGGLADKKQMNEKRSQKIVDYLERNTFI